MQREMLIGTALLVGAISIVGCDKREDRTSNNKTGSANVTPGENARTASDTVNPTETGTPRGGSSDASGGTRGSDVTPATQPSQTGAGMRSNTNAAPATQPSGS